MLVLDHHASVMKLNIQVGVEQENWTCIRTMDGAHVQIDVILMGMRLRHVSSWNEFAIGIGLDPSLRSLYFGDPWCEPKTTQTKTYSETLKAFFG